MQWTHIIWDQIYTFNVIYAAGYETKITDWLLEWMDLLQKSGLYIIVSGILAFLLGVGSNLFKRTGLRVSDYVLIMLLLLYSLVIYLQHKVHIIYLFQLMPEATLMTGIMLANTIPNKQNPGAAANSRKWGATPLILASLIVMLLWPLKDEVIYSYNQLKVARDSGYLTSIENRPEYIVAKKVQELAPDRDDRIWVFGFGDDIYVYTDRLPAIAFTDAARLQYVLSPADYEIWLDQFMNAKPKVVVSYLTQDWTEANEGKAVVEDSGRSTENLLKIARFIAANMRKVDYELETPTIYIWK